MPVSLIFSLIVPQSPRLTSTIDLSHACHIWGERYHSILRKCRKHPHFPMSELKLPRPLMVRLFLANLCHTDRIIRASLMNPTESQLLSWKPSPVCSCEWNALYRPNFKLHQVNKKWISLTTTARKNRLQHQLLVTSTGCSSPSAGVPFANNSTHRAAHWSPRSPSLAFISIVW